MRKHIRVPIQPNVSTLYASRTFCYDDSTKYRFLFPQIEKTCLMVVELGWGNMDRNSQWASSPFFFSFPSKEYSQALNTQDAGIIIGYKIGATDGLF